MALHLSTDPTNMVVTAFIDVSYAIHPDMKSHTGTIITLNAIKDNINNKSEGEYAGAVYCKSSKQNLVTRSSTEAELVGLSNSLSQVLWTRLFLLDQGYDVGPIQVMQDNQSTIKLVEKGRPTSARTRHISIRYFFVKDRIDKREVQVKYLRTEDMLGDYFSKPLQGSSFVKMRNSILGLHT